MEHSWSAGFEGFRELLRQFVVPGVMAHDLKTENGRSADSFSAQLEAQSSVTSCWHCSGLADPGRLLIMTRHKLVCTAGMQLCIRSILNKETIHRRAFQTCPLPTSFPHLTHHCDSICTIQPSRIACIGGRPRPTTLDIGSAGTAELGVGLQRRPAAATGIWHPSTL